MTQSNEPIPFVDYYCACSSKKEKETTTPLNNPTSITTAAENAASITGRHLLSSDATNYLYPLSRLYFCEDCHQIRCPSCVQDEIVSYYCPNCLFEVPTASVKSEKNRCARNCFQCPICQNTLSVVAAQEPTTAGPGPGPYFLACNVCRWSSQEIDMTFEKPTSLACKVVPEQKGEFKFPLLVTYNYKSDEDRMDVSSGDIDADEIEDMDVDDEGSKKAGSTLRLDDEKIKSYSFWCLIGLGSTE
ncbi:hypothetical protein K501DRAFT_266554 [Backusella circina FSU 941]|nr:hypothetical protein K501DRAFT_266554 [Backusella circina FSU 941]